VGLVEQPDEQTHPEDRVTRAGQSLGRDHRCELWVASEDRPRLPPFADLGRRLPQRSRTVGRSLTEVDEREVNRK